MERTSERVVRLPKTASAERRAGTRFPLTLEVRYVVSGRKGTVEMGSGRTINLSNAGLSFTADKPLRPGQKLDLSIDWPVLLDGGVRLQLIMAGEVVRTNGNETALCIRRHEFRTRPAGLNVASTGVRSTKPAR